MDNINKRALIKAYEKLCIIISIYIMLQVVVFNTFGFLLPFKLLPFPWMDGRIFDVEQAIHWASVFYLRPSGFFLEPAYAAQYLLPGLLFSLHGWSMHEPKKINILKSIIILTALFLTNSSTGIVIAVIIIFMYFTKVVRKNKKYVDIVRNIVFTIFGCSILVLSTQSELYNRTMRYIFGNIAGGGSTALRVFRGFAVYNELPALFKFIGVGHGNLGKFVLDNNIITNYDSLSDSLMAADYANALSKSLLYYGFIGFILYLSVFKNLWINTRDHFRNLVIVLFILSLVSSIFFNITMLFYMSLIYLGYKNKSCLQGGAHENINNNLTQCN